MEIERKNFFLYREAVLRRTSALGASKATNFTVKCFLQSSAFYSFIRNFLLGRYYRWFLFTANQLVLKVVDASNSRGLTSRSSGRACFAGMPSLRSAPLSSIHYEYL
jgi:hypothetical protein